MTETSYSPLLMSAAISCLLAAGSRVLAIVVLSYQRGATVDVPKWADLVPYLRIGADARLFGWIMAWSSLLPILVVGLLSIHSFASSRSPQVRVGRGFGWLSVAASGLAHLVEGWVFNRGLEPAPWMFYAVWIGVVCFVATLVSQRRLGERSGGVAGRPVVELERAGV